MNRGIVFCVIFTLFLHLGSAGNVIDATSGDTFKKVVLDSVVPVMVKFYAPWCGHCKSLAPAWEKAATRLKGVISVVKVDCTSNQGLCQRYNVRGYPTLKLFKKDKYGKSDVKDYQQQRDAGSIVRYALSNLDSYVVPVKDVATLDAFLSTSPSLPHVLLFSKKSSSSVYKSLSGRFKGRVVLGRVKSDVAPIVEKYGPITKFPHVISIKGDEVKQMEGKVNVASLTEFISSFAPAKASDEGEKKKPKAKKRATPKAVWQEGKKENLDTVCGKGICVVAFVDVDKETIAPEQNKILSNLLAKYSKDKKFSFAWVNRKDQPDLVKKFTAPPDKASLFVYKVRGNKITTEAAFEEAEISNLLEKVLGGGARFTRLEL